MNNAARLGFIGTGLLGMPMARSLVTWGRSVMVWNRTLEKAEPLQSSGAQIAPSLSSLWEASDVVFTMLTDAGAVRDVLKDQLAARGLTGRTVIQMGTIGPDESRRLAEDVRTAGGEYLEAPVLGSIPQAETRSLIVMVGSSFEQFDRYRVVLQGFGDKVLRVGDVGDAALMKLTLNQLIASLTCAFALSLGLVERGNLSVSQFMEILKGSALFAPTFEKKLPLMLAHNYDAANFPLKHLLKDIGLVHSAAESAALDTVVLLAVEQVLAQGCERGFGDKDYSALAETIRARQ